MGSRDLGSRWPFRKAIQPECENIQKVSKWVPGAGRPPGRGGKSEKSFQTSLRLSTKSVLRVSFELFETFSAPGSGVPGNPFRDFFRLFAKYSFLFPQLDVDKLGLCALSHGSSPEQCQKGSLPRSLAW